jgi:lysophospholipase L1-like esterase
MRPQIRWSSFAWTTNRVVAGVIIFLSLVTSVHAQQSLRELQPRKSLPNFFSKLHRGDSVTIAYFGGSITEAGGGWREQSGAWIQKQFPRAKVRSVNAAIGGTGSDLGVFRLKKDVLTHRPDLVFVEFAVNDHGTAPERILLTMEGIVRQIWKANRKTDICFVYTLTATSAPTLIENRLTAAMEAMEKVAEKYAIPSIQLGLEVVDLFRQNKLLFSGVPEEHPDKIVFSKDNVHPYATTGHRLYAEAVARAFSELKENTKPLTHKTARPLSKDNWENAQMIPAIDLVRNGNWEILSPDTDPVAKQFQKRLPILMKSQQPGDALTLAFTGRLAGLYDVVGPGCGQYEVSVDGEASKLYPRFDRYATYNRTHYFFLPEMENGAHTVTWKTSDKKLDKMEILSQGSQKPGDLAKFEPNNVYAGYVLLLGKINHP